MNDKQPSIFKIIWVDTWAFPAAIFAIIGPGIFIYQAFFAENPTNDLPWTTLVIFVLSSVGLAIRILSILSVFNNGLEVKAIVSEVGFNRDRGFIKYAYTHEGNTMIGKSAVMRTKATSSYQVGQEINVLVNRENPQKTLIKDLFV